ncbi:MAG: hypothetical protein IJ153_05720, partial [Clostridia bacterium]|nr:hypothetical protein [Clostridia bacterium]
VWGKIKEAFNLETIINFFKDIASNIWSGLTDGLSEKVDSVMETVKGFFSSVWDGVLSFFGIHSPSTLAKEAGENVMEGFSQGADGKTASVTEKLKGVFSTIWEGAKSVWDSVTGWLGKLFGWGGEDEKAASDAKEKAGAAGEDAKNELVSSFEGADTEVAAVFENMQTQSQTAIDTLKEGVTTAFEEMKQTITDFKTQATTDLGLLVAGFTGTDTQVSTFATNVQTTLTTLITNISMGFTTLRDSVSAAWETLATNAGTHTATITTLFSTMQTDTVTSMGLMVQAGLAADNTFATICTNLGLNVTKAKNTIVSSFNAVVTAAKRMASGIVSAIRSLPSSVASTFNSVASSIQSAMSRAASNVSSAVSSIKSSLSSIPKSVNVNVNTTKTTTEKKYGRGGVEYTEQQVTVGDTGKEYMIPVEGPDPKRAKALLRAAAADLGLTVSSHEEASRMLGGSAERNVTPNYVNNNSSNSQNVTNNNQVMAPATINVYGNDPQSTARNVAKNQEKLLVRNLRSILA